MTQVRPFVFCSELNLLDLTGRKACNAAELREGIEGASDPVIYHHTHRHLAQHQQVSPEPPNDFAHWVTHMLGDVLLGEKLASVDTVQFCSVGDLRQTLVDCFSGLGKRAMDARRAPPGYEFQFVKACTFIIPTGDVAHNLTEFLEIMRRVSVHALYYHIFEVKLRLQRGINDFSAWLDESLGERELAGQIARLDPYTYTMEGLRQRICWFVRQRLGAHDA